MKKITLILIILASLGACDEAFLERNPLDSLSPDNFFRNESECELLVNSLYSKLDFKDYLILETYTDDLVKNNEGSGQSYLQGNLDQYDSYAKQRWETSYKIIGNANLAVNGIETADIANDAKARLVGEAKFIRAYYYFKLVSLFGDVPLVLSDPSVTENLTPARAPKEDVINKIISDLDDAVNNLPVSYTGNDLGKATKGAALALKARAMIFFSRWSDAADAAKKCMDLGEYGLYSDLRGLFLEENEYNEEVIFDIGYIRDIQASDRNQNLRTQGMYLPSLSLVNEFEMEDGKMISDAGSNFDPQDPSKNRDPRLWSTVLFPGAVIDGILSANGDPVTFIPVNEITVTAMKLRKSTDYADLENRNSGTNFIILRYADVLLMYAEAKNEVSGPDASIYEAVNLVRQRAGMPDLPSGLSKDEMRSKIRHERRVEMAGEGLRYYDITRWEIADVVLANTIQGYDKQKLVDPSDPAKWIFEAKDALTTNWNATKGYLWPIPGEERELNSSLTQNPGYN